MVFGLLVCYVSMFVKMRLLFYEGGYYYYNFIIGNNDCLFRYVILEYNRCLDSYLLLCSIYLWFW